MGTLYALAGTDYEKILENESIMGAKKLDWSNKLYGDGNVGMKIVELLLANY